VSGGHGDAIISLLRSFGRQPESNPWAERRPHHHRKPVRRSKLYYIFRHCEEAKPTKQSSSAHETLDWMAVGRHRFRSARNAELI